MAQVMAEEADSLRLEPPGIEGEGVEFCLKRKGRVEYHQVKRQQSARGHWNLNDLRAVLGSFYRKLSDPSAWCVFISTQSADELRGLSGRSRSSASLDEFRAEFLKAQEKRVGFQQLAKIWERPSDEEVYQRLRRVEVRTMDETSLRETVVARLLPLVDADPESVSDVLAQFALDSVHHELTAHDIWGHLEARGMRRRDWGSDPHVLARVGEVNELYLAPLRERAILGRVIPNPEAPAALDLLTSGSAKRSVLLSGEAGVGKSSVIIQVLDGIKTRGIPFLAFRLDRLEARLAPEAVGGDLGLPGSPPIVLASVAKGRDCVLIIDQLDAVSLASGRNPQFFDCVHQIIQQAEKYPNMRLVMACRKFDLENDNRLRRLAGPQRIADEIGIKRLPQEIVKSLVAELGRNPQELSSDQLALLSLPLHLALLAELGPGCGPLPQFRTAQSLFDLFWERKQLLARERLGRALEHWTDVVDTLCDHMSSQQTLFAPESLLDCYSTDALAMASEHVLTREEGRYAFFHESFFDYAFARRFAARGQSLLDLLGSSEEHLFRRAQVRQIMVRQRDSDRLRYLADLRSVLTCPGVRFHVKQVLFALLAQLTDPTTEEWAVMESLLRADEGRPLDLATNPLARGVWGVIDRSAPWFAVVDGLGLPERWLRSDEEQTVNGAAWLLHGVAEKCPDRVTKLLRACAGNTEAWRKRISGVFSFGKLTSSRRLFDLFLQFLDEGRLDEADFWMMAYKLPDDRPDWACEAVGHYLARRFAICRAAGQNNPLDRENPRIDGSGAPQVIMESAAAAPVAFVHNVLPFVIDVLAATAVRQDDGPWPDPNWTFRMYGGGSESMKEVILEGVDTALRSAASKDPAAFAPMASQLRSLQYDATQFLLVRAYAANGPAFADEAVAYLRERPHGLKTGYACSGGGGFGLGAWATRELIQAISPHCSEEGLQRLEQAVLGYFSPWERKAENWRARGETQFVLLDAILEERRSPEVIRRLDDLRRKFGTTAIEPPRGMEVTFVGSPIPAEAAAKMTDDQWVRAINHYKCEERRARHDGKALGGPHELSQLLEKQAKTEPNRFAELACAFPEDAHPFYFDAVLRGIEDAGLDGHKVMRLCARCHRLPGRPCGHWICRPLAKLADKPLPNEALDLVAWYATECPDPDRELWRTEASPGQVYYGGDVYTAGINSSRGAAAEGMRDILFADGGRITYLRPALERMVRDPSIAVRSCVAGTLTAVLRYEPDLAVQLFMELCSTEDELLQTPMVDHFLHYAVQSHFSALAGLLLRMIRSDLPGVQAVGARQACLASLGIPDARRLVEECLRGSWQHRAAAAGVYGANLTHPTFREDCSRNLCALFSDPAAEVRSKAAWCFRHFGGNEIGGYTDLIRAFVSSPAFSEHPDHLFHALAETTASLPEVACAACDRVLSIAGAALGDIRQRAASSGHYLTTLVPRIYATTTIESIRSHCLDLFDQMMELGMSGIQDALEQLDR